jgi:WD40 repeat protein
MITLWLTLCFVNLLGMSHESSNYLLAVFGLPPKLVPFREGAVRPLRGSGKWAEVWDVQTGQVVLLLEGHERGIGSVAFSPDSKRVLTGSWDGTTKL